MSSPRPMTPYEPVEPMVLLDDDGALVPKVFVACLFSSFDLAQLNFKHCRVSCSSKRR
jgi:hypothetical protein